MSEDKHKRLISVLLLKIKEGGNEGVNAEKTLKKICEKYDLDINEVMAGGEEKKDRYYRYTSSETRQIIVQIILRYGVTSDIYISKNSRHLIAEQTTASHLEILNAIDVLLPFFRKELRKIKDIALEAFVRKHDLYWKGEVQRTERIGKKPKKTLEEMRAEMERESAISSLANTMDEVVIQKRLK